MKSEERIRQEIYAFELRRDRLKEERGGSLPLQSRVMMAQAWQVCTTVIAYLQWVLEGASDECVWSDPDDKTCSHPENPTPECHSHICPEEASDE